MDRMNIGNVSSRETFQTLIQKLPAKVILCGDKFTGKLRFITETFSESVFDADMLCVSGTVDDAREVVQFLKVKPICSDKRVVIINGEQSITEPAQDVYLSVCESSPEDSIIVFIVNDIESLNLPLVSRLDVIKWHKLDNNEINEYLNINDYNYDNKLIRMMDGRFELCDIFNTSKQEFIELYESLVLPTSKSSSPKLIANWNKQSDTMKDAILCVCESVAYFIVQNSGKCWFLDFVEKMCSCRSFNAEMHWWNSILPM